VFQVLVLVAGLENVIEQLDQGIRKEVQVSRCNKKQTWGKIITEVHRTLAFLFMCYSFLFFFFFCDFFKYFLYLSLLQQHIRRKHTKFRIFCAMTRPLEFLQVCHKIIINVWKMRSPISKPNLGILKIVNPAKPEKNRMRNLILCDLKKWARFEFRGESYGCFKFGLRIRVSSEVLEGWGFGFVDMVGFRYMIYFVDRVGCRDKIYFVDRVGFKDMILFCGYGRF
jgi:hypothetical protein